MRNAQKKLAMRAGEIIRGKRLKIMNMKSVKFASILAAFAALLFGGCSSVKNTTPEVMPENPSRTYTLSMKADVKDRDVNKDSFKPCIVIDGSVRPMKNMGNGVYTYDYVLPEGRDSAKYFFQFDYSVNKIASGQKLNNRVKSSEVYEFRTQSKYVVNMESQRGNVGSKIAVLGKGFSPSDRILLGGVEAETQFVSKTNLSFTVPSVESGKVYPVVLVSDNGKIDIGNFKVDDASLGVYPRYLDLASGQTAVLKFNIGFKAPAEGYVIDVKTNIPSSLIMDDVVVPAGRSSVTVPVKAGATGNGFIYINGFGFKEVVIPLNVR